jgi:CRP-like cAMP-binding protein
MVMISRLIRKLETFAVLSTAEKHALAASVQSVRQLGPREDFLKEDGRPKGVNLLVEGFACRYKLLSDGRRQIVGYFLPGDTCDLRIYLLKQIDHSLGTITPVTIAQLSHEALIDIFDRFPTLKRALWWSTVVDEAITREWLVNVGLRTGYERMAHLLCEIFHRLKTVGLATTDGCDLPLTQQDLADTVAMSPVHVNRVLQELRQAKLIVLREKRLTILDLNGLTAAAHFSPSYLQLETVDGPELSFAF